MILVKSLILLCYLVSFGTSASTSSPTPPNCLNSEDPNNCEEESMAQDPQRQRAGGWKDVQDNAEIARAKTILSCDTIKQQVKDKLSESNFELGNTYEVSDKISRQTVAGVNYLGHVDIGDDNRLHIRVFQPLGANANPQLTGMIAQNEKDGAANVDNVGKGTFDIKLGDGNKADDKAKVKVGGAKEAKELPPVQAICDLVKDEIKAKAGIDGDFEKFEVTKALTQVVAGTNYFVKIQISNDKYIHARIWKKLDQTSHVTKVLVDQTENDELVYF